MTQAVILAIAMVVSAGTGEAVKDVVKDATITARIETMFLLNDHLNPFNINTTTYNGVVTLSGGVETEEQKDLAEDLARSFKSVQDVVNNITVMSAPTPPRPKLGWRQRIEDYTTTASVRARLLYHKELKGLRIGVRTTDGAVTLSGVVATEVQKHKIGQIALDTRGVAKVINNLIVRPKEAGEPAQIMARQASDEWIEKRVETSIMFNRHISIRPVDVEVDDGLCILTGTVNTQAEKTLAGSIAQSIQGVRQVRNELRVRESTTAPGSEASKSAPSVDEEYVPLP